MKNKDLIFVSLIFYIGWFGCIFIGRTEWAFLSLLFPAGLVGYLRLTKNLEIKDILWALAITGVGVLFDFVLIQTGLISIVGDSFLLIPVWLFSIWLLFSFSMVKMAPRFKIPLWFAAGLGLVMGPLSYKSGEYFQVLTFTSPSTLLVYGIFWAFIFPAILFADRRYL